MATLVNHTKATSRDLLNFVEEAENKLLGGTFSTCEGLANVSLTHRFGTADAKSQTHLNAMFTVAGISPSQKKDGIYRNCIKLSFKVDTVKGRGKVSKWVCVLKAVDLWRANNPNIFANKSFGEQEQLVANYIFDEGIEALYYKMRPKGPPPWTKRQLIERGIEELAKVESSIGSVKANQSPLNRGLYVTIARKNDDGTTDILDYQEDTKLLNSYLKLVGQQAFDDD